MNGFEINSNYLESMNAGFAHIEIGRGETSVFSRIVNVNDPRAATRLYEDVAQATGFPVADVEAGLVGIILQGQRWWTNRQAFANADGRFRASFVTSAEFEKMNTRQSWLVEKMLVRGQPAMLGGPKKSLKTSILIDLAVSLSTGKQFLGKFKIPQKVRVAVLSGESGPSTIQETARRICSAKKVKLPDCDILWGFDLPRLGVDADLEELANSIRQNKIDVIFVDPAYLCLLAGTDGVQANNMFAMGPLLLRIARICQQEGATLILVHHTTKAAGLKTQEGAPLELEDLAYSGFQEFARQWVLINRRAKFEPGSGKHLLWLNYGGSAGQSGCWGVDITEGTLAANFTGRRWDVLVRSITDARQVAIESKKAIKNALLAERQRRIGDQILAYLGVVTDGETMKTIALGTNNQDRDVKPVLEALEAEQLIERCDVWKLAGRVNRSYRGYRLKRSGGVAETPKPGGNSVGKPDPNSGTSAGTGNKIASGRDTSGIEIADGQDRTSPPPTPETFFPRPSSIDDGEEIFPEEWERRLPA